MKNTLKYDRRLEPTLVMAFMAFAEQLRNDVKEFEKVKAAIARGECGPNSFIGSNFPADSMIKDFTERADALEALAERVQNGDEENADDRH